MMRFARVYAITIVLFAAITANAAEVIIKPSKTNKAASDIYIKQTSKSNPVRLFAIPDVYKSHYHPAEYVNGSLYIITRPGGEDSYKTNPNWTQELWRYNRSGKGTKLYSRQGLDFRVANNEKFIAVLASSKDSNHKNNLYLLNKDGKLVGFYPYKDLATFDLDFVKWNGSNIWLRDVDASSIKGFIKLDTRTMKTQRWDVSKLNADITESDFNISLLCLAYSDYPLMFDVDSERDFVKTKRPVKLYVYDLKTKRSRLIAQSITKPFMPKWISSTTLEYENPNGKGRMKKQL